MLDVAPRRVLARAADVSGCAIDTDHRGTALRRVDVRAEVDDDGMFAAFHSTVDGSPEFVGRAAGKGFRASLAPLTGAGPTARLLRRLLWDLPISMQVAGQTALLDHDAARTEVVLSRRGTDQCSGWRADGEMMRQVDRNAAVLVMPLGPTTAEESIAEHWQPDLPALRPMATRRSRVLSVGRSDARGRRPVTVRFRDSYADPDGVSRALHEWTVRTELAGHGDDVRFAAFVAEPGRLPWVECPIASTSALRLSGRAPGGVEQAVGADFLGISTCTHLNDTLRSLAGLPDLIAELDASA